jgi:hypothetical protein
MNVYVEALRKLAPGMGAYQNEVSLEYDQCEKKEVDNGDTGGPVGAKFSADILG